MLENHPIFPERANISLAQIVARDHIRLRVWERGAGLTKACGTAACAALVAAARKKLTGRRATVTLPGGDLLIEWRERRPRPDDRAGRARMGGRARAGALCRGGVMTVEVVTFGCRLNTYESEAMRGQAAAAGHADLVIVNTCAVTAEATRQARQSIRRLARENPHRRIVVTGCAAQIEPERFAALPGVAQVVGNGDKLKADDLEAGSGLDGGEKIRVNDIMSVKETALHLIDGMRGRSARLRADPERLRSPLHLLHHPLWPGQFALRRDGRRRRAGPRLVAHGIREVVLTGVDITGYGGICPARRGSAGW